MRPVPCGLACIVWLVILSVALPAAWAQNAGIQIGVAETRNTEPEADTEGPGVPYSRVLRDTEPPYEKVFSDVRLGSRKDVKVGPGGALFQTHFFSGPVFNVPLVTRGGRPSNAEIKIGNFYIDVRYLSTSILYSDNVNATPNNTRDGIIGIVRVGLIGILQVSDNLRMSLAGTLVYLPFRNKIGIAGFGIDDLFANLDSAPIARFQTTYNMEVGRWEVQVYDDFEAAHRHIGIGEDFDFFNGVGFDGEDRAGRYVFGDNTALPPAGGGGLNTQANGRIDASLIELRNTVGFSAGKLLPTVTRVEFGARHSDFWYQGDHGFVPNSHDEIYALAQSERENLRFKPFIYYRADRYNFDDNWNHELRGGVGGPLSEYVHVMGSAGYHWTDASVNAVSLWHAQITHTIGPYTYHEFDYSRTVTEPIRDVREAYYYRIQQVIGPYLYGEAFAEHATFEPMSRFDTYSEENRAGVRLTSNFGLRTTARAGFVYSDINVGRPAREDVEAWRARAEIHYHTRADVQWLLSYQYTTISSTRVSSSYDENLVVLTLVKYF